jgi:hypothetical protein
MGVQSDGVLIARITGLLTWESQEKRHLDVAFMACHKEYYKGEGGGFSQVRGVMSLLSACMSVTHLCIKNVPTMH